MRPRLIKFDAIPAGSDSRNVKPLLLAQSLYEVANHSGTGECFKGEFERPSYGGQACLENFNGRAKVTVRS